MEFFKRLLMLFLVVSACSHVDVPKTPKAERVAWVKLEGEIDRMKVASLSAQISEVLAQNPTVLLVEINSPGGQISSGDMIGDLLEASPIPVVCVVDKEGMSMAFFLLQSSCDRRIMTKRSVLMIHRPSMQLSENVPPEAREQIAEYLKVLTQSRIDDMVVNMKVTSEYVMEKINKGDWFMGWKEALDIGAVDRVVYRTEDVLKDPLREY